LFTCNPEIGADLSDLFNFLTGFSRQRHYRKLIVAPGEMRNRFHALIAREMAHARAGRPARLIAKFNALADAETILALYEAAQAGVEIDLIVRGICCLRPGIEGVSENIRVTSVVGRFLEHSRLWYFLNDGDEEYYLGSADWMPRNFERRVEAVTPVEDKSLHEPMRMLLSNYLRDNRNAWILGADGHYTQRELNGEPERSAQQIAITSTWGTVALDP
jgi:polyphosphate kinase